MNGLGLLSVLGEEQLEVVSEVEKELRLKVKNKRGLIEVEILAQLLTVLEGGVFSATVGDCDHSLEEIPLVFGLDESLVGHYEDELVNHQHRSDELVEETEESVVVFLGVGQTKSLPILDFLLSDVDSEVVSVVAERTQNSLSDDQRVF